MEVVDKEAVDEDGKVGGAEKGSSWKLVWGADEASGRVAKVGGEVVVDAVGGSVRNSNPCEVNRPPSTIYAVRGSDGDSGFAQPSIGERTLPEDVRSIGKTRGVVALAALVGCDGGPVVEGEGTKRMMRLGDGSGSDRTSKGGSGPNGRGGGACGRVPRLVRGSAAPKTAASEDATGTGLLGESERADSNAEVK